MLQREGKQAPQRVVKMSILLHGLVMSPQLPNGWIVSEWVAESKAHTLISVRLVESVLPALHSQKTPGANPTFGQENQAGRKPLEMGLEDNGELKGLTCTT